MIFVRETVSWTLFKRAVCSTSFVTRQLPWQHCRLNIFFCSNVFWKTGKPLTQTHTVRVNTIEGATAGAYCLLHVASLGTRKRLFLSSRCGVFKFENGRIKFRNFGNELGCHLNEMYVLVSHSQEPRYPSIDFSHQRVCCPLIWVRRGLAVKAGRGV